MANSKMSAFDLTVSAPIRQLSVEGEDLETPTDFKNDRMIKWLLFKVGIPYGLSGYSYLISAVKLYYSNPNKYKRGLYQILANAYNFKSRSIREAIYRVIEIAWQQGSTDTMEKLFGKSVSHKPANYEFIAMCAEWLKQQQ